MVVSYLYLKYNKLGRLAGLRISVHSERLLCLDKCLDSIVHVLSQLDFVAAKSSQVGNIEDTVVSFSVLAVGTTDLNVILISDSLELVLMLLELG